MTTAEIDALRHADNLMDTYRALPVRNGYPVAGTHVRRAIVSLIEYGLGLSTAEGTQVFRIMRDENMSVSRAYRYSRQVKA